MAKLYELATVLRSKNSGPFEITLDVFFEDENVYQAIKKSGVINKDKIQEIYQLDKKLINDIVYFDAAQGIKITYARTISSGTCFDRDVYGAQQHAPLMELDIDLPPMNGKRSAGTCSSILPKTPEFNRQVPIEGEK